MKKWESQRTLSVKTALKRTYAELEKASGTPDSELAKKHCEKAQRHLERIDISQKSTSDVEIDRIVAVYDEHRKQLEKLGLADEAQASYRKAKELSLIRSRAPTIVNSSSTTSVATNHATTPSVTPGAAFATAAGTVPVTPADKIKPLPPLPWRKTNVSLNKLSGLTTIFTTDRPPSVPSFEFPEVDGRLLSTRQLAFCLALLRTSASDIGLDPLVRAWLKATNVNHNEKERLNAMPAELIRALVRDELKDTEAAIAEVVCLAPVLHKGDCRRLLSQLVNWVHDSVLLNDHALKGIAQLIQDADPGHFRADDLVKILELLSTRLQKTFQKTADHVYPIMMALSLVLDAMADNKVEGLDRIMLHAPLLSFLTKLRTNKDPFIVFQAEYAMQALLLVPDDEKPWQAVLRRSGTVIKGVGGLASAIKELNIADFIHSVGTIQDGLQGADQVFDLVVDAYKGVIALKESGQSFLESFKNGLSFNRNRDWYPQLRGIDAAFRNGELSKFKILVCEAPCLRYPAFQWGVCQRLGDLAADPVWETDSRKDAIAFLGEIYRNDKEWGQEPRIKQYILDILMRLVSTSENDIQGPKSSAKTMLEELKTNGDESKQALYRACCSTGPSSYPWNVSFPHFNSSPLLDIVQNKSPVELSLRKYQRLREQEQPDAVYIPLQAKSSRDASDDNLFNLTDKVNEFLAGDQKVFLLLGDSGAGKSTFNLQLEKDLWREYDQHRNRIPVFVTLPAIEKPEKDLIGKQLREYDFTDDQIRELKTYYKFILICDGYDECQNRVNLYNRNRLNKSGEWNVKMVISCRSEYLGPDYLLFFQPGDVNDLTGAAYLQEAVVAPFSKVKIQNYVQSYVKKCLSKGESVWSVEDYLRIIESVPNLQELVTNPFLLSLSLVVLPRLVDPTQNVPLTKISRVTLYDRFLEFWVERGQKRLIGRGLTGDDQKAFGILSEDGFTKNAIKFVKDLATAIFDKQNGNPVVDFSPVHDRDNWKASFFGHVNGENLLLEACPIPRTSRNQYQFIHRSVLEYALARAVFEPHQEEKDKPTFKEDYATTSNSPLFRQSFAHEPSIISFLAERVQQSRVFKCTLLKVILQSRDHDQVIIAATNAITILVRAQVRFNGEDLKGIRIPGADLSNGQFDSTQLQGADLRNTNLRNIWLRQANLSDSQMDGINFSERPFLEQEDGVQCGAFSPDGATFASGLDNGAISLYNTSTWERTHTLDGRHSGSVLQVQFSPNGQQIAYTCDKNIVWLWDTQTESPGPISTGQTDRFIGVAYSPNGQQIALVGADKKVRLWDACTGAPGPVLTSVDGEITCVAYSPNGQQIATGNDGRAIQLWDAQTGTLYDTEGDLIVIESDDGADSLGIPSYHVPGWSDLCVTYSPNGQQIATSNENGTVQLWDGQTGARSSLLTGHTGVVVTVTYSPNGQQIALGTHDGKVWLWDAQTGTYGPVLSGHTACIRCVRYSPNGQQIASTGFDNVVRLWEAQTGVPGPILTGHTGPVEDITYLQNGRLIASSSADKTVRLWDIQTGISGPIMIGHDDHVKSVAWSPNGQQILSGSDDHTVRLWDALTGAPGLVLTGHTGGVQSVAFSPNGQQIVSGSNDSKIRLWNTQTGSPGHVLSGLSHGVQCVTYSPNGQQIASGDDGEQVLLWDPKPGARGSIMTGLIDRDPSSMHSEILSDIPLYSFHSGPVMSVTYSPNGKQIASGGTDGTVRLLDAHTGRLGHILTGHTGGVQSVTYSPSGRQIASGSTDGTVRLWDAETRTPVHILKDHTDEVWSVAYSPDGQMVASGSADKTVRLWNVASGQSLTSVRGFGGIIYSIAWRGALEDKQFVTACEDKSVCVWRVVEDENRIWVNLIWSTSNDRLVLSNALIQGVRGLSQRNRRLLQQSGADGNPKAF
ncbi:hypothetical protein BGZ83_008779 [Gryganskiella cystojenkinii]|nr:hypothetical protein BGZ83_008779 [Gryganskiella cystojenkinii]